MINVELGEKTICTTCGMVNYHDREACNCCDANLIKNHCINGNCTQYKQALYYDAMECPTCNELSFVGRWCKIF